MDCFRLFYPLRIEPRRNLCTCTYLKYESPIRTLPRAQMSKYTQKIHSVILSPQLFLIISLKLYIVHPSVDSGFLHENE